MKPKKVRKPVFHFFKNSDGKKLFKISDRDRKELCFGCGKPIGRKAYFKSSDKYDGEYIFICSTCLGKEFLNIYMSSKCRANH